MRKIKLSSIILTAILIILPACEKQLQKKVVFQIGSIDLASDVVAQGDPINVSASFLISGTTNQRSPSVMWESDQGSFDSPTIVQTIFTPPSNYLGDLKIKLTATFMGHTDVAERIVKIVKTPATSWGSLSGFVLDENQDPLADVIVMAGTGETDTTDSKGYFYLDYLPQGTNGLDFMNVSYAWATELPQEITVSGGNHRHLGNIILYASTPPLIQDYQLLPDRRATLSIQHKNPGLIDHYELYRSIYFDHSETSFVRNITPQETEITIQEDTKDVFYALRSIPLNGDPSNTSEWAHIEFINVVDPDPAGTVFTYNNFFSATLSWQFTGFENYYKGFRIAENANDTGLAWISPLLTVNTRNYQLNTEPGDSGEFYVLAISGNDLYNETQPESQKIVLDVPMLETPDNFRGSLRSDGSIRLSWEPLGNNNNWYEGYRLEKKVETDTSTVDWEELIRITTSLTATFTDTDTDPGNLYYYRISSMAYSPLPGNGFYSPKDSIIVSTE